MNKILKGNYLCARDEQKIIFPWWIEEIHFLLLCVICSNLIQNKRYVKKTEKKSQGYSIWKLNYAVDIKIDVHIWSGRMTYPERKDIELLKARSHAQNLLSMISIIKVPFRCRMAHTGRIPSNNIEICTSINTSLSMPLHLSWPSIMHWRGEDCNNSWFWVEDTFLKNLPGIRQVSKQCNQKFQHITVAVQTNYLVITYQKRHHLVPTGVLDNLVTLYWNLNNLWKHFSGRVGKTFQC